MNDFFEYGEGSMYARRVKRADGTVVKKWEAARNVKTPEGAYKRITGWGKTQSIAAERMEANYMKWLEGDPRTVKTANKRDVTLDDYAQSWLAACVDKGIRQSARKRYGGSIRLHIVPFFGKDKKMKSFTTDDVKSFIRFLKTKPKKDGSGQHFSEAAQKNVFSPLSSMLKQAHIDGIITADPLLGIKSPRPKKGKAPDSDRVPVLIPQVIELLHRLEQDEDEYECQFVLSLLGLRQSERLGVTWSAIHDLFSADEDKVPILWVEKQLYYEEPQGGSRGRYYLTKALKTEGSYRNMPLVEPFRSALLRQKKRQEEWKKIGSWKPPKGCEDLVLTNERGKYITQKQDNAMFRKRLKEAGIEPYRGHLQRHITATMLAESSVPPELAQRILGHSSEAMTRYYTHLDSARMVDPMRSYGRAFDITSATKKKVVKGK